MKTYNNGYKHGYVDGYEIGKNLTATTEWVKGYQAAFNEIRRRIEQNFEDWAHEPVPSRINQPT